MPSARNYVLLYSFALFYFDDFKGNFQVQAPGGLCLEGQFNGEFFALQVWEAPYLTCILRCLSLEGLIFGILW